MLTPVSRITVETVREMLPPNFRISCRYLVRKYMVPSLAIPNAIEKIRIVDGFNGILKYPIIAAVISNGVILGISAITTIRKDINIKNITVPMRRMASNTHVSYTHLTLPTSELG